MLPLFQAYFDLISFVFKSYMNAILFSVLAWLSNMKRKCEYVGFPK